MDGHSSPIIDAGRLATFSTPDSGWAADDWALTVRGSGRLTLGLSTEEPIGDGVAAVNIGGMHLPTLVRLVAGVTVEAVCAATWHQDWLRFLLGGQSVVWAHVSSDDH